MHRTTDIPSTCVPGHKPGPLRTSLSGQRDAPEQPRPAALSPGQAPGLLRLPRLGALLCDLLCDLLCALLRTLLRAPWCALLCAVAWGAQAQPTISSASKVAVTRTGPSAATTAATTAAASGDASTSSPGDTRTADNAVRDARQAARQRDRQALAAARAALEAAQHPLLPWLDYWDLGSRLREATVAEVEALYQRWPGSYVEDRLRNDWLLELGRRRDFPALAADYPRFRMDDDREVRCWWLLTEHLAGREVTAAARAAWLDQRELDDGCNMLATALVDTRHFSADDVWLKAKLALEQRRPAAAKAAVSLLGESWAKQATEAVDNPSRYLRRPAGASRGQQELRTLALMRVAADNFSSAADQLVGAQLSPPLASWAWAYAGRQAAFKLAPEAAGYYQQALALLKQNPPAWSDDTLAWGVRSALRGLPPEARWPMVLRLTAAMSEPARQAPAWRYWQAQALAHSAPDNAAGGAQRQQARRALAQQADPLTFYGQLAADELGLAPPWPAAPAPPSPAERDATSRHPGLQRALLLMDLGLRSEGRREWNFSLRDMNDRQRLAAARLACERSDWQLCINTAERSQNEVDLTLRYPMPWQAQIQQASAKVGLEPAYVFGLIRQETRFMPQLRSGAGASGLMQVMPGTAKLVARKLGLRCCTTDELYDMDTNLMLGTQYLRWALDDLDGSQALAAAAYNAGPGRPKRWREGATMDAAAWAEHVPFDETRDYVQKVLANAAVYAGLLAGRAPTLRPRLGQTIGPSQPAARPPSAGSGQADDAAPARQTGSADTGTSTSKSDNSNDNP